MAISSRLALWEQKIREEDRSPPPTSPPPVFSVIPGGFIKQLVRQTEKESKEAKSKEKLVLSAKEDPPGKPTEGTVQQFVIKETDLLDEREDMTTTTQGQLSHCRLNGEKHGGEGVAEPPARGPLPLRRTMERRHTRPSAPSAAESAPTAPQPEDRTFSNSPQLPQSPEQSQDVGISLGQSRNTPEPAKEDNKRFVACPGKENVRTQSKAESQSRAGQKEKATEKGNGKPREAGGTEEKARGVGKKLRGVREELGGIKKGSAEKQGEARESEEEPAPIGGSRSKQEPTSQPDETEQEKVPAGESEEEPERSPEADQAQEDTWYETEKVWLVQKDGFTLATELKPDVGTPELPPGRVRVRVEADGATTEVDEEDIQKTNPPSLDYAEDLASLVSLNESSIINTLRNRCQAQLMYTYAGSDLIAVAPSSALANCSTKAFKGKQNGMPPHVFAVAQRAYWRMLMQQQDQAIVPLGRSNAGKTSCCQNTLEYLVATAGSIDDRVTVEKIQAMFTVLRAFGTVSTGLNEGSTRFSMLMALDFNATGRITAGHLQTLLLEKSRVVRQPEGESSFNVFALMLAGLDLDQRTTLHLHQMAESSTFGIQPCLKAEEKQKASAAFAQLRAAMETLGITSDEQKAVWHVVAGIYHLGAAGACRVGRKQFMQFECANRAADVLGCDFEELNAAVFKHHLKQIIEQVTAGSRGQLSSSEDRSDGPKLTGVECVEGMATGLYEELFAALVSLINRCFSSNHLSMASILVVDTPGFHNPRHQKKERAATFEELCHNYSHERLQVLFYKQMFVSALERYQQENIKVPFDLPELSPTTTVNILDQNTSQTHALPGGQAEEPKGLLWILDEEALIQGSSDSTALNRLCSYFAKEGVNKEEQGPLRKCEQALQFEISHQLGKDPVRYDATGWVNKAKWNLSAQNAVQVLQQSKLDAVKKLFQLRSKVPLICRSVAGLEGSSQQALQRVGCVRKTFTSTLAAVKKKSVCAQVKLQLDALANLVKRSQIHFVHCLVSRKDVGGAEEKVPHPCAKPEAAAVAAAWDIPTLRVQLSGAQILEALRLYRIGYADRMVLAQFRRRFQILAQPVMKKYTSAYEMTDESKAIGELFQALNLEKKSIAVGRSQVFLKAGVLPRLEKQRERLISQSLTFLQAACKGFLSRQKYRRVKIQHLAIRCIQKNMAIFQGVRAWPWWGLMSRIRPLLTANLAEEQVRAKEEALAMLRKKLETSDLLRQELRQSAELLETKLLDLTAELADERLKGDVACQILDGERAERLRGSREIKELQGKCDQLQKKLESSEKQLEETQQQLELRESGASSTSGKGDEWQMLLDCAQTEIAFLRKRIVQLEERLELEQNSKKELEEKLSETQKVYESTRRTAQQLQRKCKQLTCDLEDTRVLMESQQSWSHELQKKQKKFDLQLAQALGESAFEKSLREKVSQNNTSLQVQVGKLQLGLQQKESENATLNERIATLGARMQELSTSDGLDSNRGTALQKKLWDLESSASEQQEELSRQAGTIQQMEQLHLRLELEIERMKQLHQKELEDKEEELEDVRQSCQKRLRQLEMQCAQEGEEKQVILHEKQDMEGLVATLCEQIGHRDFDVEKKLRRDLKRSQALLADVQLLLETSVADAGPPGSKEELEKLRRQWEDSEAKCAEAQKSQKMLALEVEHLHVELEAVSRNKSLLDEQLYQLQHEKADLLKRVDEDQEDLNELMAKHKALIAQSATDIAQTRELQSQLEDMKKEKQDLQERFQGVQIRVAYLEQSMVERSIVSRQEALIRDLENKLEFQSVQIKRFEMLVLRLRDSVIKMGDELEKAKEGEAREKENMRYYQMRMEEMKADMSELAQRELEANQRRMQLEKQVHELSAVRQTLQADLETSIRRIADLQVALEEVRSSDESDTERESLGSTLSLNLESEGSVNSWLSSASAWSSPPGTSRTGGSLSTRQSMDNCSGQSLRISKGPDPSQPGPSLGAKRRDYGGQVGEAEFATAASPSAGAWRWEYGNSRCKEDFETLPKLGATSPSGVRRMSSLAGAKVKPPSPVSPYIRTSPSSEDKLSHSSSSSSALSEYVEELRRKRLKDKEPGPLALEDAPSLPIYQTTGASSLRRCKTLKDREDFPLNPKELGESTGAGLIRSSPETQPTQATLSPSLKRLSKFGSYDSLLQNIDESSLEETGDLGKNPLVFQSKWIGDATSQGQARDPFSWKIPTLSYERKTDVDFDDFLPAIRKTKSTSSLSRGPKERKDGQRPMTVRFEDQIAAHPTFLSQIKATLLPSPKPKEDWGHLSDSSSSSGSAVSFKSADSIKSQPNVHRRDGEGCVGKANTERPERDQRSEAEGKEDDVNSIMMKYLTKE